ncbi:MAG: hypothetical protein HYZ40_16290 [Rhodospirillales bacterium]|nr:hypothetical protein [Rhodospirillales bacterium]
MKPAFHLATIVATGTFAFMMAAASSLAQTAPGQFRDERTGKVWTPETVSQDDKAGPATPSSVRDRAFDPRSQLAVVEGVTVQRPRANLMAVLPVTAGPSVPIVTLDGASLQAVPGERWLTVIYVTNNSADIVDTVVGCTFTNADRKVQDTRVIVPPAGPGERLGMPVYGPPVDLFVDRVTCRVMSPA